MSALPLRLHQAISILSRSSDLGAADAQSAIGQVTARIVLLEETLQAVLHGEEGARDVAWTLLIKS